jgi:replicative DNA helicase
MNNLGWEKKLLGTILKDPSAFQEAQHLLPDDFQGGHKAIWQAMQVLNDRNSLTRGNVEELLRTNEKLDSIGDSQVAGSAYLQLLEGESDLPGLKVIIEEVEENATKRHIGTIGTELAYESRNGNSSRDIIERFTKRLMEVRRQLETVGTIGELVPEFEERLEKIRSNQFIGNWKPPVSALSDKIGYLEDQDFVLVPARPGMGKSSALRNWANESAVYNGKKVLVFNFENSRLAYAQWFISWYTGIDNFKLKFPKQLTPEEMELIEEAKKVMAAAPIFIKDAAFNTPTDIVNTARKMVLTHGINLIEVDYLQLISGVGDGGKYESVLNAAQMLRNLSIELGVPIIAAAQLTKEIDKRDGGGAKPTLGDIAYAGEQPSKHVWAPWAVKLEPQMYGLFPENRVGDQVRVGKDARVVVIKYLVLKNSNGPTGETSDIAWDRATDRFCTLEEGWRASIQTDSKTPKPAFTFAHRLSNPRRTWNLLTSQRGNKPMYKLTQMQLKNNDRIMAWLNNNLFAETGKKPAPVDLSMSRVFDEWTPRRMTDFGQFFTPLDMGRALVSNVILEPTAEVLEPCAGIGHLLWAINERYHPKITAYEIDEINLAIGKKLFGDNIHWAGRDPFLHQEAMRGHFDFVVMNPPFGMTAGMGTAKNFSQYGFSRSEHLFLELAINSLKPGGTLLMIAPFNAISGLTRKAAEWFKKNAFVEKQTNSPHKFKGTALKADLFVIRKRNLSDALLSKQLTL